MIQARVVRDPQRDLLVGAVLATGATFETRDPREMAELLFSAGVRHGHVAMPDWREGDSAPSASEKIALNQRLNQLGRSEPGSAMEALCQSAATSYSGSLTPAALMVFLRTGVVTHDCSTQLNYAIEELPAALWRKAIQDLHEHDEETVRRTIASYAQAQRLYLNAEMSEWLAA